MPALYASPFTGVSTNGDYVVVYKENVGLRGTTPQKGEPNGKERGK